MKQLAAAAAIALALMGAFVLLRMQQEEAAEAERAAQRLLELDAEAATTVSIWRRDEAPARVVLATDGDTWILAEPVRDLAAESAVGIFLTQLDEAAGEGAFEVDDLREFELDAPHYRVTVTTPAGQQAIALGRATPVGGKRYARVDDTMDVHTLIPAFLHQLRKEPDEWRNKNVFRAFPSPASRVVLTTADGTWTLERRGETWFGDGQELADTKVEPLLTRIENLTVREFVADGGAAQARRAELGLEPAPKAIEVYGQGPTVRAVFAGGKNEEDTAYAWVPDDERLITVSGYVYDSLWPTIAELVPPPPAPATATTAPTPMSREDAE